MVTSAAYNLFYRKRGMIDLANINYEALRQSAVVADLEQFKA